LSNEEKTNDYENFEKGMIYMKILKKGGGGNEIHAPCACAHGDIIHTIDTFQHQSLSLMSSLLDRMAKQLVLQWIWK
jgi:hypothetical protein